ncbi:17355_t:CDS:2, partial [Cetraspora pellucida]
ETIIPNTPPDYASLYEKCWSTEPNERPTLNEILSNLDKLSLERTIKFITNNVKDSKNFPETTSEIITNSIEVSSSSDDLKNSSTKIQHPSKILINELRNFFKKYFLLTGITWILCHLQL